MIDENKKSIKNMLKSNGLYFALGLTVLAAGIVGMSALTAKNPSAVSENTTAKRETVTIYRNLTEEIEENNKVEINIEDFTVKAPEEPSTAAVFDNDAESVSEKEEAAAEIEFHVPLKNAMGKDYSMGVPVFSETMKDYRTHNGVDFKGVKGESVSTVAEGTVISVTKDNLHGNTVTVDHGNGIISQVSGLADEALVAEGTYVYSDTIIGVVGEIPVESQDDSHIHLEMRVNGELVDPLEIMGLSE